MTEPVSDKPICAICTEEIGLGDSVSKLNCNHKFHRDCLKPWLDTHNTCPLDRYKITTINGIAVQDEEKKEDRSYVRVTTTRVRNPSVRASALLRESVMVILNPSLASTNPVERQASRISSILFIYI